MVESPRGLVTREAQEEGKEGTAERGGRKSGGESLTAAKG